MKGAVDFLRGAITARGENLGLLGTYVARNGLLYVQGSTMQAGIPFSAGADFILPAAELENVIGRMGKDPKVIVSDDRVQLSSGRIRSTIASMLGEPPDPAQMGDDGWLPVPSGLVAALALAAPFTADEGTWAMGIRLAGNVVTALSNRSGIQVTLEGCDLDIPPVLLTKESAKFIAEYEPEEFIVQPSTVMFRWFDGRWMRAQLLAAAMPSSIDGIFANAAGQETPAELTEDWRSAFQDAVALTGDVLEVMPDRLVGRQGAQVTEIAIATACDKTSKWAPKVLDPMVKIATAWNPSAWPNAAAFTGPNFRGAIMGMRV